MVGILNGLREKFATLADTTHVVPKYRLSTVSKKTLVKAVASWRKVYFDLFPEELANLQQELDSTDNFASIYTEATREEELTLLLYQLLASVCNQDRFNEKMDPRK